MRSEISVLRLGLLGSPCSEPRFLGLGRKPYSALGLVDSVYHQHQVESVVGVPS